MREREGQAEDAGEAGAEAGGAEQPDGRAVRGLHAAGGRRLDRARDRVDAGVGMAVREVVVEEAGQLGELLGEVVGALVEPVRAAQGGGRRAVGAGGAAEAEVDTARGHRLQGAELLGDDQGRVVGQHDAARTEADALGVGGEMGQDHGRGRGRHSGHGVVFCDPVAVEAAVLGQLGDLHAGAEGVGGGAAGADGHQIEDRKGHGGGALGGCPDLVVSGH